MGKTKKKLVGIDPKDVLKGITRKWTESKKQVTITDKMTKAEREAVGKDATINALCVNYKTTELEILKRIDVVLKEEREKEAKIQKLMKKAPGKQKYSKVLSDKKSK